MDEEVLFKAFVSSFSALVENKEHFVEKWKAEDGDELRKYKAVALIGGMLAALGDKKFFDDDKD